MPSIGALLSLSAQHHKASRIEAAATLYRRILTLEPAHGRVFYCLGIAMGMSSDARTAVRMIRRSVLLKDMALDDNLTSTYANLAVSHYERGASAEAILCLQHALILNPSNVRAWNDLGRLHCEQGRFEAAEATHRHALRLDPQSSPALDGLGLVNKAIGSTELAITYFQAALDRSPDTWLFQRNLLWTILCSPTWGEARRFQEHCRYATRPHGLATIRDPDPDRRLRVGYLSSDLYDHPVGRNLEPLLHDRDPHQTAVFFYSVGRRSDAVTDRFRGLAEGWRDVRGRSDAEIADAVRGDGIDILVFLAGRFDDNRPLVAAHRPAPVQISLFDAATSGLDEMNFIITDRVMTLRNGDEQFTERPIRLPTLFAYRPLEDAPAIAPSPCLIAAFRSVWSDIPTVVEPFIGVTEGYGSHGFRQFLIDLFDRSGLLFP